MDAKQLNEHIKNALKAFNLQHFEGDLVSVSYDPYSQQLIFSYETSEYRVSL